MAESHEETKYLSAQSFLKVQGVLSLIFGSIGVVVGSPLVLLYSLSLPEWSTEYSYTGGDWIAVSFIIALGIIFWIIPHVFMIIAGSHLVRHPKPGLAKGLTVANLVIGALYNYILMAFAIVSLVQSSNYEAGYRKH